MTRPPGVEPVVTTMTRGKATSDPVLVTVSSHRARQRAEALVAVARSCQQKAQLGRLTVRHARHSRRAMLPKSHPRPWYESRLAEAIDPTTPGERLLALWKESGDEGEVFDALMHNPALPPRLLARMLTSGSMAAWFNPTVPLVLLVDPSPDYERAACRLLALATAREGIRAKGTLAKRVRDWSARLPSRARQWAQRFAHVFGLPWPAT